MLRRTLTSIGIALMLVGASRFSAVPAAQAGAKGSIKGHVRLMGKSPGNPIIRMGMDPMCARINAGKRVIQEAVLAALDGSLANVFVSLKGTFPQTPVPTTQVLLDQHGCVYTPRVVGVRVGQALAVRNSDSLLHNVHGLSAGMNSFNVGEPIAGMVQQFKMKQEEIMLHVKCDVHSWMNAWVGVVNHPYFAVSDMAGTFQIDNVPPGTYTIQAWHERYGPIMQMIRVKAGAATDVSFSYTGTEAPPKAMRELTVPEGVFAAR